MDLPRTMGAPAENPSDAMQTAAHLGPRLEARPLFLGCPFEAQPCPRSSGCDICSRWLWSRPRRSRRPRQLAMQKTQDQTVRDYARRMV